MPAFFIDVTITNTQTAACELETAVDALLLEFVPDYDFNDGGNLPGSEDELPEIRHDVNGAAGTTRNIAKLVRMGAMVVDAEFPARAP
jgi:hypothetical protein